MKLSLYHYTYIRWKKHNNNNNISNDLINFIILKARNEAFETR